MSDERIYIAGSPTPGDFATEAQLAAEATRATAVEATKANSSDLSAETTRAEAAESVVAAALTAEITRAQTAEAAKAQALVPTAVKTSAYNAAAADFVPVDISGGTVVTTLPNAPADKTRIGVKVVKVSATPGSTSASIAAAGADVFNIASGSTALTLSALFQGVLLQYAAGPKIWYVSTADTPLGQPLGAAQLSSDGSLAQPLHSKGGIDGVALDMATGAPGTPFTVRELRSITAPDAVSVGTNAALSYNNSDIALGPLPMWLKITASSASVANFTLSTFGQWTWTTHGRAYVQLPALPNQSWRFVEWFKSNSARCTLDVNTAGKVRIGSGSGSSQVGLSTNALSINTRYRIEWAVTRESSVGASDGTITVSVYNDQTGALVETFAATNQITGTYIDSLQAASVNNSNLGSNPVYFGGFADGWKTACGAYAGAPYVTSASSLDGSKLYGGFTPNGEFVIYAARPKMGDSQHYWYQPGEPILRVNEHGITFGSSKLQLPDSIAGTGSVTDGGWDRGSLRFTASSQTLKTINDPPDVTLTRFGFANNELSGTNGSITAGVFTVASPDTALSLQTSDTNRGIIVNGTQYFIKAVLSQTSAQLVDVNYQTPANVSGVAWSVSQAPYPEKLQRTGGSIGQVRTAPGAAAFNRSSSTGTGSADLTITAGTGTGSSTSMALTSADVGRYLMVNRDTTRIYKILTVAAPNFTFGAAQGGAATDTAGGTNLPWAIAAGDTDGGATELALDNATVGFDMGNFLPIHWDGATNSEYGPVDFYISLAANALYTAGASLPKVFIVRHDGRIEIPNTLYFTDPTLTAYTTAPLDTAISRSAAYRELHTALGDFSAAGLRFKTKAGAPADSDWTALGGNPPDGTVVINTSGAPALDARIGGVWTAISGAGASSQAAAELAARGLINEAFPLTDLVSNTTLTSGTIYAMLVGLLAGTSITNICFALQTIGVNSGSAPTLFKVGIMDTTGKVLAASADQHASATLTTATGVFSFPLNGGAFTIPTTGGYYLAVLEIGAFSTPMQLARASSSTTGPAFKAYSGNARKSALVAGQSDLAVNTTYTLADPGGGNQFWLACS